MLSTYVADDCKCTCNLVNQTTFLGMALIDNSIDYKCLLREGLEHFHSMVCSTDIQILSIVDWPKG